MLPVDSPAKKRDAAGSKKRSVELHSEDGFAGPSGQGSLSAETCGCSVLHEDLVALARDSVPAAAHLIDLGELFKLFGDPTRLRILSALAATELCVCDLGEVLGMSQSSISHQLALLRAARLVKTRRAGKVVFYSLDDSHVGEILKVGLDHVSEKRERS